MQNISGIIKKAGYYIPFTIYFIVFSAIVIPGYLWLKSNSKLPDSAYKDIISLLLSVALLFSVAIICFGLITVITSYIYFKWKLNKGGIDFRINTSSAKETDPNKQSLSVHIKPVIVPVLGFIRIRILYDHTYYSTKFSPLANTNGLFHFSFDGEFSWNLPEIREYKIEKVIIYFEDFFQFFSIATTVDTNNRFFISPTQQNLHQTKASPRKTEETSIRIEELKRVEGELINYKNFETNDDVRRIVWKIYAKNKELVVRIPEILDPYASHIYLYTSFFSGFKTQEHEVVNTHFLNYYKTICWSVYKQLSKKGFEVKCINDQPVPVNTIQDPEELMKYSVAVSSWQQDTGLKDFVKPGYASVLLISSLSDVDQVKAFAENFGSEISIVYVPLTESLEQNTMTDWVKWVFVQNEKNTVSSYKTQWNLSTLRFQVKENEKQLMQIVKQTSKASII